MELHKQLPCFFYSLSSIALRVIETVATVIHHTGQDFVQGASIYVVVARALQHQTFCGPGHFRVLQWKLSI